MLIKSRIRNDIILITLLTVLGIAGFLVLNNKSTQDGSTVCVYTDGKLYAEYSLNTDLTEKIVCKNGYNILVIKNGSACISEADCSDETCVKTGSISKAGESIICLPNRLEIVIKNDEEADTGVDAVAE